jgi:hypothetical protein
VNGDRTVGCDLPASDDDAQVRARRRLRAEKGFYAHLAVYAGVISLLAVINWSVGRPWWFVWPALGWGIGLALHGLSVFGLRGAAREWEQRRLAELLGEERLRR